MCALGRWPERADGLLILIKGIYGNKGRPMGAGGTRAEAKMLLRLQVVDGWWVVGVLLVEWNRRSRTETLATCGRCLSHVTQTPPGRPDRAASCY